MNSSQTRIAVTIDVFEEAGQQARVLRDLKPPQLIKAILQEFHGLEYLVDDPDHYCLIKAESDLMLDEAISLEAQVRPEERLVLAEREKQPPEGSMPPSLPIYLRELRASKTYPIGWLPAIIGRRSENRPQNELVAVDLSPLLSAQRVSRRHVQLTESSGRFYVQNLRSNPVSLLSESNQSVIPITAEPQVLSPGDIIRLDRSEIELKFIVRKPVQTVNVDPSSPTDDDGLQGLSD